MPAVISRLQQWTEKHVTLEELSAYTYEETDDDLLEDLDISEMLSSGVELEVVEIEEKDSGKKTILLNPAVQAQKSDDFDPNAETRVHSSLLDSKEIETLMELGGQGIDEWEENTYARKSDLKERRT